MRFLAGVALVPRCLPRDTSPGSASGRGRVCSTALQWAIERLMDRAVPVCPRLQSHPREPILLCCAPHVRTVGLGAPISLGQPE